MISESGVAEVQLKYRPNPLTESITTSAELNRLLVERVFDTDTIGYKESFKVLFLNRANRIIGYNTVSEGGLTATVVDIRTIMQGALLTNATTIVLAHNHPSGTTRPSIHDDELTKKIREVCRLFDIQLLDHIIVTPFGPYYSYCDEGRL